MRGPDAAIATIAANQHGVVSAGQLNSAGLSPAGIDRRVRSGRLHRVHRGAYAVGHPSLSIEGRWIAAVIACGEGAVLSHRAAALLWGIRRRDRRPPEAGGRGDDPIEVTVPGDGGRAKRRGFRLYRSSTLLPEHCTRCRGIPVTTPRRTLADLRTVVSAAEFNAAAREAEFLRLPIGAEVAADRTRTELESRFRAVCRRHRLPQPEVNVRVGEYEVDFLWRDCRLIAEVDGWDSHRTRFAFEEDRARDAHLAVLGYRVVRFTWRQITDGARAVAATIRALLQGR